MSLAKLVPAGLKNRECKRIALREPTPVPYVPKKDKVQDAMPTMKGLQLKASIGKDTTLHLPMWNSGTKKAMLMLVMATLDTIKKCGHFQEYDTALALYMSEREAAKQVKAGLSLLDQASKSLGKFKKSLKKAKEAEGMTKAQDHKMQATFQADLEKAKEAAENAKGAMTAAANKMFAMYANLLSIEAKYAWKKIVEEQTEGDPYVDLQGILQKGPRGVSHQIVDNGMMFHLLTVFPINAAEQEKYYIANVLKKPQRVNVRQFVILSKKMASLFSLSVFLGDLRATKS